MTRDLQLESRMGVAQNHVYDPEKTTSARQRNSSWWQKCCGRDSDPEVERKAIVKKDGGYRLNGAGLRGNIGRYITDIYVTLLGLQWRYAILIMFGSYFLSFGIFAVFWWLVGHFYDDFDNLDTPDFKHCLFGVKGFPGAIMYSIETQTTIGYGYARPDAECPPVLPMTYFQTVLGFFMETFIMGFVFVKIVRPKFRAKTLIFSNHAVINQENGNLVLQVRLADLRKSNLIDSTITGMLIRRHSTEEGAYYPLYQFNCEFTANGMGDRIFLLWPIILTHVIDKDSPLYDIRPADLSSEKFEIVLYLLGTVDSTGEMCQARTSYLPKEIRWGHRFDRIEEFDIGHSRWNVDLAGFNDSTYCQDIRHSAKELDDLKDEKHLPGSNHMCNGDASPKLQYETSAMANGTSTDMNKKENQVIRATTRM